jgi:RHS repeat-associated protein
VADGSAGNVSDHVEFGAFGTIATESNAASGIKNLYTGLWQDRTTGVVFADKRTLLATTGQWMQEDPIEQGAGLSNFREYVGNNPQDSVDPSGLQSISEEDILRIAEGVAHGVVKALVEADEIAPYENAFDKSVEAVEKADEKEAARGFRKRFIEETKKLRKLASNKKELTVLAVARATYALTKWEFTRTGDGAIHTVTPFESVYPSHFVFKDFGDFFQNLRRMTGADGVISTLEIQGHSAGGEALLMGAENSGKAFPLPGKKCQILDTTTVKYFSKELSMFKFSKDARIYISGCKLTDKRAKQWLQELADNVGVDVYASQIALSGSQVVGSAVDSKGNEVKWDRYPHKGGK